MKTKNLGLVALLAAGVLTLTGCGDNTAAPIEENVELANPASVYCEENWWILQIETAEDWSQSWICLFEDGSYCEEWSYFNNECQPGEIIYNTFSDENTGEEIEGSEDGDILASDENVDDESDGIIIEVLDY